MKGCMTPGNARSCYNKLCGEVCKLSTKTHSLFWGIWLNVSVFPTCSWQWSLVNSLPEKREWKRHVPFLDLLFQIMNLSPSPFPWAGTRLAIKLSYLHQKNTWWEVVGHLVFNRPMRTYVAK